MRRFAAFVGLVGTAGFGAFVPTGTASASGPTDSAAPGGAVIRFVAESTFVEEGQRVGVIRVERSTPLSVGRSFVDYATVSRSSTATAGSDYADTSGTLVFEVGETVKSFTVGVRDDTEDEPTEQISLALTNPRGDASETGGPAVLVIIDNDTSADAGASSEPGPATPSAANDGRDKAAPTAAERPTQAVRRVAPSAPARRPRPPTPFEFRSPARNSAGAPSEPLHVEPVFAVIAGLLLARVAAQLWFRHRTFQI